VEKLITRTMILFRKYLIVLVQTLWGKGIRLFDESINEKNNVKLEKVIPSNDVVHLFYKVIKN
jgi:hypothetical protein